MLFIMLIKLINIKANKYKADKYKVMARGSLGDTDIDQQSQCWAQLYHNEN